MSVGGGVGETSARAFVCVCFMCVCVCVCADSCFHASDMYMKSPHPVCAYPCDFYVQIVCNCLDVCFSYLL